MVVEVGMGDQRRGTRRGGSCRVRSDQHRLDRREFLRDTVAEVAGGGREEMEAVRVER